MPVADDGSEGGAVGGVLGDGLAECQRRSHDVVDREGEMVGCYGGADVGRKSLDLDKYERGTLALEMAWRDGERRTHSTAASVVQCSRTMRSFGNLR